MPRHKLLWVLTVLLCLPAGAAPADGGKAGLDNSAAESSYRLVSSVLGAGGTPGTSSGKLCNGTLGQSTPPGEGASSAKLLYAGFWGVLTPTPTGAGVENPVFRNALFQNTPNPFNPSTIIRYTVAEENHVELAIFNVRGQLITTLVNGSRHRGSHDVSWDGKNGSGATVASGVYFCRLKIGSYQSVKKLLLLK